MESREVNIKLLKAFPEIALEYKEEIAWQDGDDTGSHIVYGDVFVPFIKKQFKEERDNILERIFDYLEMLLAENDEYINEVVAFSVIESLMFDDEIDKAKIIAVARNKTLSIIKEIADKV